MPETDGAGKILRGYDIVLSIAADGKTTAKARKSGSKKTVASASSQLVLRDYVPGEGWTCELPKFATSFFENVHLTQ